MTSELTAILEKEANAECERLLAEARAQAEQLVAEAQKEARAFLEAQRQRLDAERKAARTRAEGAASVRASALVLQAKDQAIAEVFTRAEAGLAKVLQNRAQYASVLRGLTKEAAAALEGKVVVEVHPNDLDLARTAVRELKLDAEVKAAQDVSGGVRLSSGDGRFIVENTLLSRVDRVRSVLPSEIAALLWGQ